MTTGKIAWCTTLPAKGAGGFRTIVQNARALERMGYASDFYFMPDEHIPADRRQVLSWLRDWYDYQPQQVYTSATELRDTYDLAIATAWNTASFVADQRCEHKAYFIQDYEPWFFPRGCEYLEAQASYRLGLTPITIGRWLAKTCQDQFQSPAYFTDFCADLSVYHPLNLKRDHAICAIYQPEKSRRAGTLLLSALEIVKEVDPALEVRLYGSDADLPDEASFEKLGILSVRGCNELYNTCELGISMSTSNPSRIPFEMMASGLPVIDLQLPNNLFDMPEDAVRLAEPNAASLASTILALLDDRQERAAMSVAGSTFMSDRDITLEGERFANACERIIGGQSAPEPDLHPLYTRDALPSSEQTRMLALAQRKRERAESSLRAAPPRPCIQPTQRQGGKSYQLASQHETCLLEPPSPKRHHLVGSLENRGRMGVRRRARVPPRPYHVVPFPLLCTDGWGRGTVLRRVL